MTEIRKNHEVTVTPKDGGAGVRISVFGGPRLDEALMTAARVMAMMPEDSIVKPFQMSQRQNT